MSQAETANQYSQDHADERRDRANCVGFAPNKRTHLLNVRTECTQERQLAAALLKNDFKRRGHDNRCDKNGNRREDQRDRSEEGARHLNRLELLLNFRCGASDLHSIDGAEIRLESFHPGVLLGCTRVPVLVPGQVRCHADLTGRSHANRRGEALGGHIRSCCDI